MHTITRRHTFIALAVLFLTIMTSPAWARLPRPIQATGTAVFVDHDTQSLVFKAGKDKKPLVLDWNKDTDFLKDGQAATAAQLKSGIAVSIHYRKPTFGRPLLTKAFWNSETTH